MSLRDTEILILSCDQAIQAAAPSCKNVCCQNASVSIAGRLHSLAELNVQSCLGYAEANVWITFLPSFYFFIFSFQIFLCLKSGCLTATVFPFLSQPLPLFFFPAAYSISASVLTHICSGHSNFTFFFFPLLLGLSVLSVILLLGPHANPNINFEQWRTSM